MQKSISKIERNGMYGYVKNFQENGVGLVVINIGDDIKGIRLKMDGNENFNMSKDDFYKLMDTNAIQFIEILPKFVIKELQDAYLNNLKKYKDAV